MNRRLTLWIATALMLTLAVAAHAGDWMTYRHDAQRSSAVDERLLFPMRCTWAYRCAQTPRPAWPETIHILNRLDFDYAPHPVTGGGQVYFGSTADDTVRALDEKTGELRWSFVAGGPIRFAPQYAADRIYFGSDDGNAYCLDAATGKPIWKFHAAPYDDLFVGNGRMISRWPIRTGVLVMDETVYFAAGMWNTDGIHLCALNAQTGAVVWRNDNAGFMSVFFKGTQFNRSEPASELLKNNTHEGEFGASGITPQGALLAWGDNLIVPNGTSFAWRFNRKTGDNKIWQSRVAPAPGVAGAAGGTWNCIDQGVLYTFNKYRTDVTAVSTITVETGIENRGVRVTPPNFNVQPAGVGSRAGSRPSEYIHDKGKASVIISAGKGYTRPAYTMVLTDGALVLGLDGAVVAEDTQTQRELWRAPVEGVAREIAVANGRVLVSTERGVLYSFEPGRGEVAAKELSDASVHPVPAQATSPATGLVEQLRAGGMDRGFALVLGDADAKLSQSIAEATSLSVINVQAQETAVGPLRNRLLATTSLYGTRLQVLPLGRPEQLAFARYFANAVIVASPVAGLSGRELYRVLRPYGGMLLTPGLDTAEADALLKYSGATPEELSKVRQGVVRGEIPGARDWDSRSTADKSVAGPVRVLWFGGPDTRQTQSFRQSRNPPTVVNGRYLALAESRLSAVDAYNGTVQWSLTIPHQNRDLREVNGVIYSVTENPAKGVGSGNDKAEGSADALVAATRRANTKESGGDAHAVNDADMVSMDESTETGGGRALRVMNDQSAFLVLGQAPNDMWIEMDLRSGKQKQILTAWTPAQAVSLQKPQEWKLPIDAAHSGVVRLEAGAEGLLLTLSTRDPAASKLDAWDLFFDLRPLPQRAGLLERGAFHLMVMPPLRPGGAPTCVNGNGPSHPSVLLKGDRTAAGTTITVTLPWGELQKIADSRPTSFGFAATLNSHDGGKDEHIVRRHLFADWASEALNHGWANVFLGPVPDAMATQTPSIVAPLPADMAKRYPDQDRMEKKSPPILADATALRPRVHPLTGELGPKIYRPGTGGCGGPEYSATARFGRAVGSLGLYDFADDSGLRNLSGIKAGCSTAITPALGLVIITPEGGHCICSFPFATTVTLAPDDRRPNEDWAIYHDRPVDTLVRQAAINLGAFGDRRDDHGTLWLGFPRPPERAMNFSRDPATYTATAPAGLWLRYSPAAMQVPLEIECLGGDKAYAPDQDLAVFNAMWATWTPNHLMKELGPYRLNTDVIRIAGTDRPWVYGSGYRGLKRATLKLDFRQPLVSNEVIGRPAIDGKIDDTGWGRNPTHILPSTHTQVFLRHDAENLYIAMKRPAVTNRLGQVSPWSKTTKGEDASVWEDDSCEVFLSDEASGKVIHLGVSASGARYDALASGQAETGEDAQWNAPWTSATYGDETSLAFELAIPFTTLTRAGLAREHVAINLQINQKDVSGEALMYPAGLGRETKPKGTSGEAVSFLGLSGRAHCSAFVPLGLGKAPLIPERTFTLRLHFAELDDAQAGQRVFDVKVQGRDALKDLDVVKEVGVRTALVKEVAGVKARGELIIEFAGKAEAPTGKTAPMLSAIELCEEGFRPPAMEILSAGRSKH